MEAIKYLEPVKRIEMIVPSLELSKVLDALKQIGISDYSIMRNVIGSGERGFADNDLGRILSNDYILTTCSEVQEPQVVEIIHPILKQFGGICMISDARWIYHRDPLL